MKHSSWYNKKDGAEIKYNELYQTAKKTKKLIYIYEKQTSNWDVSTDNCMRHSQQ